MKTVKKLFGDLAPDLRPVRMDCPEKCSKSEAYTDEKDDDAEDGDTKDNM